MFKKLSDILEYNPKKSSRTESKYYKKSSFNFLDLISQWGEIVGGKLAQYTIPLKNQNKTLTILTHHPAYSQQLSFMEEILKKKIYAFFPESRSSITRLSFQASTNYFEEEKQNILKKSKSTGRPSPSSEKPKIHAYDPKYKKLKKLALEEFSDIADEEVRESLISLFIQLHYHK